MVLADNWYATDANRSNRSAPGVETVDIRDRDALALLLAEGFDRVVLLAAQASRPSRRRARSTRRRRTSPARASWRSWCSGRDLRRLRELAARVRRRARLSGEIGADHPYGLQDDLAHLSKIYGELVLDMHARRTGFDLATLRLGIVYGPSPVEHERPESQTVVDKFRKLAAPARS